MSRKFNINKFIKDVLNNKYALVIGNEIILDTKVEPTKDVHKYFLRKVNEFSNFKYENYYDIALDKSERINPVRQLIESEEIKFDANQVSQDLKDLLNTRLFTTILTTTTDGFLEAALKVIFKGKLRVVNIYDKDTIDNFQKAIKACRKDRVYNEPTLIYVFGKMEEDMNKKYVRTDADAILLIEKWMKMEAESYNELLEFIRHKRLLALGCKYDDWYFRFFWYVLTGSIDSERFEGTGEVAFMLNTTVSSENKLRHFLDRTNICVLGDTSSFIREITKTLTIESEDAPFRKQIVEARHSGGIFISYCSKDALTACQLFSQLCNKKYDVWLDNSRLYGGDNYEKGIYEAIGSAKIFIALLTPQIAEDLENKNTEHFYNTEWQMASQFNDKIIIPVAVNGYDLRSEYHKVFESIVQQKPSGINLMEADGFHRLINSINESL